MESTLFLSFPPGCNSMFPRRPATSLVELRAYSADELLAALSRMVAELHDDHATVSRPTYDNGIWPIAFRLVDNTLYVTNGIGAYASVIPRGSSLEGFNGQTAGA